MPRFRPCEVGPVKQSSSAVLSTRTRHPGAFSLIELLVVIAIIAVLVTLGFSWARSALDRGNASKCAANLRTLSAAAVSFAADNGGKLPWYSFSQNPDKRQSLWFSAIGPYLGATVNLKGSTPVVGNGSGPECLICPARPKPGGGGITRTNIGYGWNFIGLSEDDARNRDADKTGHSVALTAIGQPAKTVMIACTGSNSLSYVTASTNPTGGSGAQYRSEGVHNGKANAVFCDGHVELMQMTNSGPADNPTVRGLWDNYWWRVRKP